GDRIRLVGPLPQEVLRRHYHQATVFALPCIEAADGDRDILPNVIKEALAVGLPVVTTRLAGIEELVEQNVSGLLVTPGDVTGLADNLQCLLSDGRLRARLARQGRVLVQKRFDRRANVAKLKNLLLEACTAAAPLPRRTMGTVNPWCHDEANCVH